MIKTGPKNLFLEALEKREDIELSSLAEYRDKNDDTTIGHEDAWK
ncbi:MAG TPA: hypothetical protein VGT41_03825 [Candidatus Babeliales bacterium]|nr:hypothetical protein [Candidatus Babeliales bacterium]